MSKREEQWERLALLHFCKEPQERIAHGRSLKRAKERIPNPAEDPGISIIPTVVGHIRLKNITNLLREMSNIQ